MKYIIAAAVAALLLLAGVALAGAGHGWIAGGVGCFALAPISFLAVANGLERAPSFGRALAILVAGIFICVAVAAATTAEGGQYLGGYVQDSRTAGVLVALSAYLGSLLVAALSAVRAKRVLRHGT